MASEEGLKISLQGEVSSFIAAMRAATAAVGEFASNIPKVQTGLGGMGSAAAKAAKDTQVSAEAAAKAAQAFGDLGKRFVGINELSEALATLRKQAASADTFGGLQEFNQQIQLIEREVGRLKNTGQVVISARFDGAPRLTRDIQTAQAAIQSFVAQSKQTNFQFNNLAKAPAAAGQALNKFVGHAGNANGSLVALTRVAQDAPFGFIAIQNNVSELFGAFQQLSRQTGSSAAALKALGSSLLGAGGITLAFSVLTSVLTYLTQKYGSLGNAMEAIFGTITDQEKAARALSETLKSAGAEYTKAAANVGTLRGEIQLAKDGFIDKDKVVKHYNDTIGKTVGSVKNLDEAERSLQQNAEAYIKFTLLKAAANQAQQEAAKKALDAELERSKTDEQSSSYIFSGLKNSQDTSVLAAYQRFAKENREKAAAESEKDQKTYEDIAKKFQDQAAAIAKNFKFDFFEGQFEDKGKKGKGISDILKELDQQITAINVKFAATGGTAKEVGTELQNAYEKALEALSKLGITTDSQIFQNIKKEIDRIQAYIKSPQIAPPPVNIPMEASIDVLPTLRLSSIKDLGVVRKQIADNITLLFSETRGIIGGEISYTKQYIEQSVAGAFSTLGESIGNALSPGGGIQNVILGFANLVSGVLQKVGEDMIKLGVAMLAIRRGLELSFSNPALAIGAGLAAIAAAQFIKSSAQSSIQGRVPHFATGGVVTGPTLAMVGDNPSGIEYMIPKEVMDKMGGGGQVFIGDVRLSGSDFVIGFKRAEREMNR